MGHIATPSITVTRENRSQEHRSACDTLVSPITKTIGVWTARARQRQALAELDDRLLADIGVTRQAAKEEAGKPFWE